MENFFSASISDIFYENLNTDEHALLTYLKEQLQELVYEHNTTVMIEIGTESEISTFLHEATSILFPIVEDLFSTLYQALTPEYGRSTVLKNLVTFDLIEVKLSCQFRVLRHGETSFLDQS